jgi:hypothetical protein
MSLWLGDVNEAGKQKHVHTFKDLTRSVAQAQICEKKRGRSHGALASHQVGDGILVTASDMPQVKKSRFYVEVEIDHQTGEPVEKLPK